MLQGCFNDELDRPSAVECLTKLVRLWKWQQSWEDHENALQPPRRSPCVFQWEDLDRATMFYRVSQLTTELLIARYQNAPDDVKSYTVIANFLEFLRHRKVEKLQAIANVNERVRKQKYSARPTVSSAQHSPLPHAETRRDVSPNPIFDDSIPESQISDSFSEHSQKYVPPTFVGNTGPAAGHTETSTTPISSSFSETHRAVTTAQHNRNSQSR